jgi:hypothetical protein
MWLFWNGGVHADARRGPFICNLSSMGVFMRVATFVLGISLFAVGGVSEASESIQNPAAHRAAAVFADGVIARPGVSQLNTAGFVSSSAMLAARDIGSRNSDLSGPMGFVPSQNPASFLRSSSFGDPRITRDPNRFDPSRIPLPATRSLEDHLLTGFIALMLIAYQLRRKHRFLRPHQFST